MLQRTYPGQLPTVRRDCFNLVIPVDLTNVEDVRLVLEPLLSFVKRKLAIRIGLVPITSTPEAAGQAKVVYHLLETYGLSAITAYLEASYALKSIPSASKAAFETTIEGKELRLGKEPIPWEDI